MKIKVLIFIFAILFTKQIVLAQEANYFPLTQNEKRDLLLIARDALDANIEGREPRVATVDSRLQQAQGLAVSIYQDEKLVGRAWKIYQPMPLYIGAKVLAAKATTQAINSGVDISQLKNAQLSLAVFSNYKQITDEKEIAPKTSIIFYTGFKEGLALPRDGMSPIDLLHFACKSVNERENAWMIPENIIYSAETQEVDEPKRF